MTPISLIWIFLTAGLISVGSCSKKVPPAADGQVFVKVPASRQVKAGMVDEASGIAASKHHPGFLWVQQDSGNPPELSLINSDGELIKKLYLKGAKNRDWEDMAMGNGPLANTDFIYLADIGDNNSRYESYTIYRFAEPKELTDTITKFDQITFRYPDGAHDAEAFFVDNSTRDAYIITKRDTHSKVFKLSYPHSLTDTITASLSLELPFNGVVSAAISSDSKEIIVKTYTNVYYWKRQAGETIQSALSKPALVLDYIVEPQGEALCFDRENNGFFTLSEKPFNVSGVSLNYYKRK
jgi:hypothetical protein